MIIKIILIILIININYNYANSINASIIYKKDLYSYPEFSLDKMNIQTISPEGKFIGGNIELNNFLQPTIWYGNNYSNIRNINNIKNYFDILDSTVQSLSYNAKFAVGNTLTDKGIHAILWYGNKWIYRKDLGTLLKNNLGESRANVITPNGVTIGGTSSVNLNKVKHAIIWDKDIIDNNFLKKDLEFLDINSLRESEIKALSIDGSIAAGFSETANKIKQATIWHGPQWKKKTLINKDFFKESSINCIDDDGKIAAGFSETLKGKHAYVWFGNKWKYKLDLGTLKENNLGYSYINAMNNNGSILGGCSQTKNQEVHGTIWYGTNWIKKLDLGTLKDNNKGFSNLLSMSKDGTLAIGYASSNTGIHPILWKLNYLNSKPKINLYDFNHSLNLINKNNLLLINLYKKIINNLSRDIINNKQYIIDNKEKRLFNFINLNTQINDYLYINLVINKLNKSYLKVFDNLGLGINAYISNSLYDSWYIKPSISIFFNSLEIFRKKYLNINEGNYYYKNISFKIGNSLFTKKIFLNLFTQINSNYFLKNKYIEKSLLNNKIYFDDIFKIFNFLKLGFNCNIQITKKINFINNLSKDKIYPIIKPLNNNNKVINNNSKIKFILKKNLYILFLINTKFLNYKINNLKFISIINFKF